MFRRRIRLKDLVQWCHTLGSALRAGITMLKALQVTGRRGRPAIRTVTRQVAQRIKQGDDLATALRSCSYEFPPLFVAMTDVATHTGHLPEILKQLEDYFRFQLRLRRELLSQIFWPVFQLVAAILIIAGLIFVLGMIPNAPDFLGLGLSGSSGALLWLVGSLGSMAGLVLAYWVLRRFLGQSRLVDKSLLRIPVLGPPLRSLALSRLCVAMHMTLDTGMSVTEAIALSLAASDNGALTCLAPEIIADIRSGNQLQMAFSKHGVFPDDFLEILTTGEETGSVPEAMLRLSGEYNERAEHQLAMLNTAAGFGVWFCVAAMIIFCIFRIFLVYVNLITTPLM